MEQEPILRQDHTSASDDRLLTPSAAAEYLAMTPRFLEVRRHLGGGPRYCQISSRAIRYFLSDLRAWAEARLRTSTSDPGPDTPSDDFSTDQSPEKDGSLVSAGTGATPPDRALS